LPDERVFAEFTAATEQIAADFEARDFARALRRIMSLADRANQYIDEHKPWLKAKQPEHRDAVVGVCSLGLNLFRMLIVLLKPVIPAVAARAEGFLACGELQWNDAARPLLAHRIAPFETLLQRLDVDTVQKIIEDSAGGAAMASETSTSDTRNEIDIELFSKVDLRVARIIAADFVEGADKLLELKLDLGDTERTVFAGIRSAYDPAALVGKHVVVVANLKPRKMRFGTSEGMVLAAGSGGQEIFLLSPDQGAQPGMPVR
jgi:methionyl-tRNA synthetase